MSANFEQSLSRVPHLLTLLASATVAAAVSAVVALWFVPYLTIRQEKGRRRLLVRDAILRAL